MLKEVIRPDQSAIRFKYDAFGRRTEKVVTGKKREKVIRFLWNGNMPFHEWEEMREADRKQPKVKVEYQADFMQRLAEREAESGTETARKSDYMGVSGRLYSEGKTHQNRELQHYQ